MSNEMVPWNDDLLERKIDSVYLYKLIQGRSKHPQTKGSVVINVDAKWGQGKSYFIRNMFLDVRRQGHPAITIDAWKYDYVDDPYTYVMAELDAYFNEIVERDATQAGKNKVRRTIKAVQKNAGKLLWSGLKGAAKRASRYVVAEGADEMIEIIEQYTPEPIAEEAKGAVADAEKQIVEVSDKIITSYIKKRLDDFAETKASLESFRSNLTSLLQLLAGEYGMKLPMYVFIDELDRCRPTYAIQMLERIKHLFDIPNLSFVIATDTTSLSHSIKAVYGSEFDSKQYLQRFFHRTYRLPTPPRSRIIVNLLRDNDVDLDRWTSPFRETSFDNYADFFDTTSRKFGLTVRQAKQSILILTDITNAADDRFPLEIVYLYCLICDFISEGDLEPSDSSRLHEKTKRFGGNWSTETNTGTLSYYNIILEIDGIKSSQIHQAYQNIQSRRNSSGSPMEEYLYHILRQEFRIKREKNSNNSTEFYQYHDLINCAKNAYVEHEEEYDIE